MNMNTIDYDADVIIVGAGPAGLLSAILLGQQGHSVKVIERHPSHYPLPRAVTFDDEIARILSGIGFDADSNPNTQFFDDWYELINGKDQVLARYDWRGETREAWHRLYWFNQPVLEEWLLERLAQIPNVSLMRGYEALDFNQDEHSVLLTCRAEDNGQETMLRAKYLVGSDGANSMIRNESGLTTEDLGFQFDWLIVDMEMKEPLAIDPPIFQYCDPSRPTTVVPAGPGRRRWEFMVLPGETPEQLSSPEVAWELMEKWGVTPENASLERNVVWRFGGSWSNNWRSGRILIAGDAAHLMPPFAGQGMCAAFRDAKNLAWKLDLTLSGKAENKLLDTYGDERREHVRAFIDLSIGIGQVVCITDPQQAAERDRAMIAELAENGPQPAVDPNLSLGHGGWIEGHPDAGKLSTQGYVRLNEIEGRFDEVVGRGWTAIGWKIDPKTQLNEASKQIFEALKIRSIEISDVESEASIYDRDGTYNNWFHETDTDIILIRPDFYVACATSAKDFSGTVLKLGEKLHLSIIKQMTS